MACMAAMCKDNEKYQTLESCALRSLAKQLQFYKPPTHLYEDAGKSDHIAEPVAGTTDQGSFFKSREKRAAVLVCIFEGHEGELRVILTKRSMKLFSHPGDVALPGGKMEEGDADDSATALREAMEEIGLDPALVKVVATLEPFISGHLIKVVPVVGVLGRVEDFKPLLNPDEVDAVFDAPLETFLKEDIHRYEQREWRGWKYMSHLFDFESAQGDFLIGGLTASILIRAASIVYQQLPFFFSDLPDFQHLQRSLDIAA
ncbi:hypothetical protein RJ639_037021 [Escallonia herrerae]|uniref:Nudix hydrolase domain-containing protein n=1 Tax=Escallonia herrerae TaxID=1293975 RepID=A0AA88WTF0_9ASTE|nr:hypothetical protein RJ639_037021 [Escallonia herrerae]